MVYFWPDLGRSFSEIGRVLKPGGRLALLFRTNASQAIDAFPSDIYHFPALGEVRTALESTGFSVEMFDAYAERTSTVLVTARKI